MYTTLLLRAAVGRWAEHTFTARRSEEDVEIRWELGGDGVPGTARRAGGKFAPYRVHHRIDAG